VNAVRPSSPRALKLASLLALVGACADPQVTPPPNDPSNAVAANTTKPTQTPPAPAVDVLGPKPTLGAPKPFTPPQVDVFQTKNGLTVWLVERHGLPIVSVSLVVQGGSASDPADKPGLANITTDMLDEGAGKRSAVEVSSAINDLGATMSLGAGTDGTLVALTVLKKNFDAAFDIFSDVVARPRLEDKEWKRVSELWRNDLKKRADQPMSVSRVVNAAVLYGPGTPYGHPSDGLLEGAAKIDLPAVKRFYADAFRPDRSVMVVAGDITRKEVTDLVDRSLGAWKAPAGAAKAKADVGKAAAAFTPRPANARPKVVLVDRPGAPQSVIAVLREGVAATDPDAARLDLVNTVLGGSFTSRLNQNLREEHHWAYGAGSSFHEMRGTGPFVAIASVETPATGLALKEMIGELQKMASAGLSAEDLEKAKAHDRAELMQTYETVSGISRRLSALARLSLPPGHDLEASRARQSAKLEDVLALAKKYVDPAPATIVVIGPRGEVVPQLAAIGLAEPEAWDPEGKPLAVAGGGAKAKDAGDVKKDAAKKPAPKK
jgi:predicted Zn-dependent peptidase